MSTLRGWWDRLTGRSSPPAEPPTAQTLEYENIDASERRRHAVNEATEKSDRERDESNGPDYIR